MGVVLSVSHLASFGGPVGTAGLQHGDIHIVGLSCPPMCALVGAGLEWLLSLWPWRSGVCIGELPFVVLLPSFCLCL